MDNQAKLKDVLSSIESGDIEWPSCQVELSVEHQALIFNMTEQGGLSVTATANDEEWLVIADVAPTSSIADQADFNEAVLRLGMMLPLVNVGIAATEQGDAYVVYAQLFADCKKEALSAAIGACANAALEVADLIEENREHAGNQ